MPIQANTLLLKSGLAVSLLLASWPAAAQISPEEKLEEKPAVEGEKSPPETAPAYAGPLWERGNLLGSIGGLRTVLDRYGISLGLSETSEVLGNPTGGRAQGTIYEGATEMGLGIDLEKAIGLKGGIFNVTAWQIHGRGLTTNDIDNLNVVSNIEADRSTRLFELWYQQSILGGVADIRIGQLAADQEFITTQFGSMFINASFGFPTLPAIDLPAGGPAYPLATPGVRLRVQPPGPVVGLLGVFNGNPAGPGLGDPQQRNASGTNFNLNSGAFVIGELQYALNSGEHASGLPGTYKLGAWYNSNPFPNQFLVATGATEAPPGVNSPGGFHGDWSIYAVVDQVVYRPPGAKDGGLGVFARAMGAPGDRNQVEVFLDGGLTYKGAFGRPNDTIGLGFGWTKISSTAAAGDRALAATSGAFVPIRTSESVVELTYQAQVAPWWVLQPDFQYIFNPQGGVLNPNGSGKVVGSAAVFGLRTFITF